jgi:hypothetical protein
MKRYISTKEPHFVFSSIKELHRQLRQFNGTLAQTKYLRLTIDDGFYLSNEPSHLTVATLPAGFVLKSLHHTPLGILHKLVLAVFQGCKAQEDGVGDLQQYVSSKDIWRVSPAGKASKPVVRSSNP